MALFYRKNFAAYRDVVVTAHCEHGRNRTLDRVQQRAPEDERQHAMREAQAAAIPSSVKDMLPLVEFMREQYQEQEFAKALAKPNVIQFPSRAVAEKKPGMQSVWVNDTYGNAMGEWRDRWSTMSFDMLRAMSTRRPSCQRWCSRGSGRSSASAGFLTAARARAFRSG